MFVFFWLVLPEFTILKTTLPNFAEQFAAFFQKQSF